MFDNLKEIFRTTISLAEERHKYYNKYRTKESEVVDLMKESPKDDNDYKEYCNKDKQLDNYLNSLEFEHIKILQTIMYLGRDQDYDSNLIPEEIYKEQRKCMDSLGWEEKHIEVNQMLKKLPLAEYLKKGCNILNIKY